MILYKYFILIFLFAMNNSDANESVWVLRDVQGTSIYIQFLDLENRKAYAGKYEVVIEINDSMIDIGNGTYEYIIKEDILTLKNDLNKFIFRKIYFEKGKKFQIKEIFDYEWLLPANDIVLRFQEKLISSKGEKRSLVALNVDGIRTGEWSYYSYESIILVRIKVSDHKNQFFIVSNLGSERLDIYKWSTAKQLDLEVTFRKLNDPLIQP